MAYLILKLLCGFLFLQELASRNGFIFSELLAQLFLLLPDFVKIVRHVSLSARSLLLLAFGAASLGWGHRCLVLSFIFCFTLCI
jgi:hypothetical protein